ncbi:hypothetical protein HON36_04845, partial [Candidatus Parcubacteria bacterium]|nr:hypothetical protein [Candidatus Parcubacteria bacterium]
MTERYNPDYIHHKDSKIVSTIREVVFGMEDGMVSTLGAVTGIAVGSQDQAAVLLAGSVIIAVESISMGMGSYISSLSERDIVKRMLYEEKTEIKEFPIEEKEELEGMYIEDGWPKKLASDMAKVAGKNKKLMLQEMAYRELKVSPDEKKHPLRNGIFMFFSYIIGGAIPLFAYFIMPMNVAINFSIGVTLIGLFVLGAGTTRYTKGNWLKMGSRVLILGSIALLAGYVIGKLATIIN